MFLVFQRCIFRLQPLVFRGVHPPKNVNDASRWAQKSVINGVIINPYNWPKIMDNWGSLSLLMEVIKKFITGRGPPCWINGENCFFSEVH